MIPSYLWLCLIPASGAALFLRLVAKEKHRRERYLRYRLEEQIKKLKEEEEQNRSQPATVEVVDETAEEPA